MKYDINNDQKTNACNQAMQGNTQALCKIINDEINKYDENQNKIEYYKNIDDNKIISNIKEISCIKYKDFIYKNIQKQY